MIPDCKWTRPRIIAYLDGEIDEPDEELIVEHLSVCSACRSVSEAERAVTARVRAVAGAERAPARLVERVRRDLAAAAATPPEAAGAAGPGAVAAETNPSKGDAEERTRSAARPWRLRQFANWKLMSASAAAFLLAFGFMTFWPSSGNGLIHDLVSAAEQYDTSQPMPGAPLDLPSSDEAVMAAYLSEKMGMPVRLPKIDFAMKQGATLSRSGSRQFGLVSCFCKKRSHAVTLFVVKADDVSVNGLETLQSGGRDFWRGSDGDCRAMLWKNGPLYYALVGDFKDQADHLALAARAASAIELCPVCNEDRE